MKLERESCAALHLRYVSLTSPLAAPEDAKDQPQDKKALIRKLWDEVVDMPEIEGKASRCEWIREKLDEMGESR